MPKTTIKLTKKMKKEVRDRALAIVLTEKTDLSEVSINWLSKLPIIGKAFDREAQQDAESGNEPVETGEAVKSVTIPLPYPDEKKADVLKDVEVIKLLNSFYAVWDITNKQARDYFAKALSADPTNIIKRYLTLAGVDNKTTKDDESDTDIKPDNPNNPTPDPEDSSPRANPNKIQRILQVFKDRSVDEDIAELIDRHIENWARKEYSASPTGAKDFMYNMKSSLEYIKKQIMDVLSKPLKENRRLSFSKDTILFLETIHDMLFKESLSIDNLSEMDMSSLINEINKFYPYAQEYMGFDQPIGLTLISDPDNAKDTFGKTAYYSPAEKQMTIFVDKRHPKDIIRSFSHELVHHAQNCRGEFDREFNVGENYIETDDHLREMEREAYEKGNMCLRHYESYLKKENKKMNLNEETLRKAIREAINRVLENKTETVAEEENVTETTEEVTEDTTNEETVTEEETIEEESCGGSHKRDDKTYMKEEEETVTEEEEVTEDTETVTEEETTNEETETVTEEETAPTSIRESLNKEKGKLIFDRLVDKWCK